MISNEFDTIAQNYSNELNQYLAVTGENVDYYAEQRMLHVAKRLAELKHSPQLVIDFGCGTGTATPFFIEHLGVRSVTGVDVSEESLAVAAGRYKDCPAKFSSLDAYEPQADFDLAFCNGVFHHILPVERAKCLKTVFDSLRPGGLFAFWENNPWNPGTQWIMSRVPFDRDAIKISPIEARRLLKAAGFRIVRTDYLFYFPRSLRVLRPVEKLLISLPFGGQYLVLCSKDQPRP